MSPKYEIIRDLSKVIEVKGIKITVYRVYHIHKDILCGWVEGEFNLSQEGNCMVYEEAVICQGARVEQDAIIKGNALICGAAFIKDQVIVSHSSIVEDLSSISGHVCISGSSRISNYARISGYASIDNSYVLDHAEIIGEADIKDGATIKETSSIMANCIITGRDTVIKGVCSITDNMIISQGTHETQPLYIHQGSHYKITVISKDYISIGCTTKSYDDWINEQRMLCRIHSISPYELRYYRKIFNFIAAYLGIE